MRALLIALFCLFTVGGASAANARMRLTCLSLRFNEAVVKNLGLNYALNLTSGGEFELPNGELFFLTDPTARTSHACGFFLDDPIFGALVGSLYLNIPPFTDANTNGFSDFYEVAQAVSSTKTGGYWDDGADSGTTTATWSRDAGSSKGSCTITFDYLPGMKFVHQFELIQYDGPMRYTRTGTNITAVSQLRLSSATNITLTGTQLLSRVSVNQLALSPGRFTNETGASLQYTNSDQLFRGSKSPGTFGSTVYFDDFDPNTSYPDYVLWFVQITDTNDTNGNGVPDLSDDLNVKANPKLSLLSLISDKLNLRVEGGSGATWQLQTAPTAGGPWSTALTTNLTAPSADLGLTLAQTNQLFIRALSSP